MPTAGMSSSGGQLKRQTKPEAWGRIVEIVTNYQSQMILGAFPADSADFRYCECESICRKYAPN
ncbi:hypothetical protein QFZ34_003131 [Phyllobacterium ifriqiyense]|uniref:Uncharacterized protein n=1 Tax=Phyllobacterium ifriqiyense TaxID=314238 RepID=A0ABU0SB19_9HYPH|nr:hypothetical protein [Phyllobacterium ifriqiyense]